MSAGLFRPRIGTEKFTCGGEELADRQRFRFPFTLSLLSLSAMIDRRVGGCFHVHARALSRRVCLHSRLPFRHNRGRTFLWSLHLPPITRSSTTLFSSHLFESATCTD
jgi:hypothetical protein